MERPGSADHGYLGNYPRALTHAALLQAALAIRETRLPPSRMACQKLPEAALHVTSRRSSRVWVNQVGADFCQCGVV